MASGLLLYTTFAFSKLKFSWMGKSSVGAQESSTSLHYNQHKLMVFLKIAIRLYQKANTIICSKLILFTVGIIIFITKFEFQLNTCCICMVLLEVIIYSWQNWKSTNSLCNEDSIHHSLDNVQTHHFCAFSYLSEGLRIWKSKFKNNPWALVNTLVILTTESSHRFSVHYFQNVFFFEIIVA